MQRKPTFLRYRNARNYLIKRWIKRSIAYNSELIVKLLFTLFFWASLSYLYVAANYLLDKVKFKEFISELNGFYSEQFSIGMICFLLSSLLITYVLSLFFLRDKEIEKEIKSEAFRLIYTAFFALTSILIIKGDNILYFIMCFFDIGFFYTLACIFNQPPRSWVRKIPPAPHPRWTFGKTK